MERLPKRSEVPTNETWDLTRLYPTEDAYLEDLKRAGTESRAFEDKYAGALNDAETVCASLEEYEAIRIRLDRLSHYAELSLSVDMTDEVAKMRSQSYDMEDAKIQTALNFYENELVRVDDAVLEEVLRKSPDFAPFVKELVRTKEHLLSDECEKQLAALAPILEGNYTGYEDTKLADMDFRDFTVNGTTYANSFVMFENYYNYHTDTGIRRAAFDAFSEDLAKYKHTVAGYYQRQVLTEKIESELRGYDSVFDYLLEKQNVPMELFDRQIDVIMEYLAPPMRRYAKMLQKIYGLEEMTFADLKLSPDPEYNPHVSIEESKEYVRKGLAVLGEDYVARAMRAYEDRWVDFAANEGKSTGGFCASPYQAGSFILLSWNHALSEVFTLVHEIGHGVNYTYVNENNRFLCSEPSLYLIEAPSTMNELLLSRTLMKEMTDPRLRRVVLSFLVSHTYFHNFVTHLLEGAFQREVYRRIDRYEPLSAEVFCEIKRDILEKFWGDAVTINPGAELTWMRQPHYYMGLYPYTYSASLTISTVAAKRVTETQDPTEWLEFLKLGATEDVIEAAKVAGVDISTDRTLREAIDEIAKMIDEMIEITDQLEA